MLVRLGGFGASLFLGETFFEKGTMKNPFKKRSIVRIKHRVQKQIDCHNWANKMEIQRLVSSKPHVQVYPESMPKTID